MKKKIPYQKDWRKNSYGNNLYTGQKVYNYNHTGTTNSLTSTTTTPNYWKTIL